MAITDSESGMVMPVAPAYGGGYGNGGFGCDGWWVILFLFAIMGNGWGNGFGGNGGEFPWLMSGQQGINANTNGGFRDAMINDNITSVRDGIAGLSTQICNTQMADMERSFASQTASTAGMTAIQAQIYQGFSNQGAATADLKYTIATEACATRSANAQNTQAILDKLCQLELDGYKRENDQLRTQLNMATLRESQTAQNALIQQGFANEVDQLYNRLSNCPVPSTPVYGRTPIFTCNNGGCGCGAVA